VFVVFAVMVVWLGTATIVVFSVSVASVILIISDATNPLVSVRFRVAGLQIVLSAVRSHFTKTPCAFILTLSSQIQSEPLISKLSTITPYALITS